MSYKRFPLPEKEGRLFVLILQNAETSPASYPKKGRYIKEKALLLFD
jgi:hypothetical protein